MSPNDVQRLHREEERLAAKTAVQAVALVEAVRCGLAPKNVLRRIATLELYERLATIKATETRLVPPRPAALRVQVVHERLAHAAVVVPAQSERNAAAYVIELGRDGVGYPWRCQELTRAEQFRLLKLPEHTHPAPSDVDKVLAVTKQVHQHAAAELRAAHAYRDALAEQAGRNAKAHPDASEARTLLPAANQHCERLERRVAHLEQQALKLEDSRRMAALPDRYRELLGPMPRGRKPRDHWRALAAEADRYRLRWAISTPEPLPEPADDAPAAQHTEHAELTTRIDTYRQRHAPAPDPQRDPGSDRGHEPTPDLEVD